MSSGIYISFPGSPARSTRQSLIWSPLGVPYAHSSKEDESCSQWDRLSGHRCGRLTNHSARAKGPSQRNRERDRPTSNLHPFNQHHHGVRFRSQCLLKSSARGPRHSPRHRVRAYQPSNQLPAQPAATNLQQQQQTISYQRPSSATSKFMTFI